MKISEQGMLKRRQAAIRTGLHAVKHKKGIHGLSNEEKRRHSRKGNAAFLNKWKSEAYRTLHRNKIRFGRIVSRFERLPRKSRDDFGFSS